MFDITMLQIISHVLGDYFIQTDKMATSKANSTLWTIIHATTYSIPFVFLFNLSLMGWLFLVGTHFVIDRFRLARYVIALKNLTTCGFSKNPEAFSLSKVDSFGFPEGTPPHVGFLIFIIVDNTMHILCNALAINLL
jgi:hypothetical protein